MIEMMSRLAHSNHVLSGEVRMMTFNMVRGMFDVTRRDLCFGGYAPWEQDSHNV
jgi:hypothetical protein